jgi:HAD superfamily hydrolase (TIGR01490 family)
MNSEKKTYVAFFDIDRTILSVNSGAILVRQAHKSGLMSTTELLNAIYLSWLYKLQLRDTNLIISQMGKWMNGVSVKEVENLSEFIVNNFLINTIRPEMLSEIEFHRENKAELVILSSIITELCRPLNTYLKFDNFLCTSMQVENDTYTGIPETKFCFEDEKRVRLIEYCKENNYLLSESFYYGDSISDFPALEVVGHPVCVSPDKKLNSIALERGWKIRNW